MMYKIYLRLTLFFAVFNMGNLSYGQLATNPISIDCTVHYGDYGEAGVDLTGYVTYEVYVNFANPQNYLSSVFASEAFQDCVQDPDSTVFFQFPCGLFQHEIESQFGYNQSCLYDFGLFPTSQFDSWLTIGKECSNTPTCDFIGAIGSCPEWITAFEGPVNGDYFDGGGFFWDEYAIFDGSCYNPATSLAYAGADNRVKIGQFTTCGDMNGCINLSYRTQQMVDQNNFDPLIALNVCFEKQHPCLSNPMDNTPTVGSAGCFGEGNQVSLGDGGNGGVDYKLFSAADPVTPLNVYNDQNNGLIITPINPGSYYISMIDSIGCRDTTAIFEVIGPQPLVLDAVQTSDVLCFGDLTGQIQLNCSGGTGDLSVTVNGQNYNCGDLIENLGCGTYTIVLTDENDCSVSDEIVMACPAALVYNPVATSIDCFGDDDGSITGTVTGGTGSINAVWTYNTNTFSTLSGNSPLNIDITNLDGGLYEVSITDANGCDIIQEFDITEPEELIFTSEYTDATCFGSCDGTAIFSISGGVEPYTTVITLVGGGVSNPQALCAGNYLVTITDANGCSVQENFTISQQNAITSTTSIQVVSCAGVCDGGILVTGVTGGYGNYIYSISPDGGVCEGTCSGTSATYSSLCAGTYSILISDEGGCTQEINNLQIASPAPLQIILNPTNVTCFGAANGQVAVSNIGGTSPITLTPGNLVLPATVTNLAPGTYSYTITDAGGCTATEDVIITEPAQLNVELISTTNVSCGNACDGRIEYEVSGGTTPYLYVLQPIGTGGVATGTINSLCALEYDLIVADFFNCLDTLEFTIESPDPLEIVVELDAPTCTGMTDGSAEISLQGGTGDLTFFITPEETNFTEIDSVTYILTDLGESVIYFELIDETNCLLTDSLVIVPDLISDMVLTTYSSPETCWNENDGTATVTVQNGNAPFTYEWSDFNMQTTPIAVGLSPSQTYQVVVTDAIGCNLSAEVFVDPTLGCFFISTGITPNGDGVNDFWVLGGLEYYPDCKVNVFNRWGQNVFESKGYNNPWDGRLKGELLPVADYYFVIEYSEDKDPILGTVTIKY